MNENGLVQTKETEIGGKKFLLSKLPATWGREVLMAYANQTDADSEKTLFKLLSFSCVKTGEIWTRLQTRELIDSHVQSAEDLLSLEMQMMEHNFSFFGQGKTSAFSEMLKKSVPNGSAM